MSTDVNGIGAVVKVADTHLCGWGSIPNRNCSFVIVSLSKNLSLCFMCSDQHVKYRMPRGFPFPTPTCMPTRTRTCTHTQSALAIRLLFFYLHLAFDWYFGCQQTKLSWVTAYSFLLSMILLCYYNLKTNILAFLVKI